MKSNHQYLQRGARATGYIMAVALSLFLGSVEMTMMPSAQGFAGYTVQVGYSGALAAPRHHVRRVSRRTSRRTAARTSAYLHALPAGCVWRAPYHYCGGVYYQPVQQSGQTVYVVVNP